MQYNLVFHKVRRRAPAADLDTWHPSLPLELSLDSLTPLHSLHTQGTGGGAGLLGLPTCTSTFTLARYGCARHLAISPTHTALPIL
jgi:hypothetical protein